MSGDRQDQKIYHFWTEDDKLEFEDFESDDVDRESADSWRRCTKDPEHKGFIPLPEFGLHHLPPPYQKDLYLDYIKCCADLTVRLRIRLAPNLLGPRPHRGGSSTGTAFVRSVTLKEDKDCFCADCKKNGAEKREWWQIDLLSADHCIFDDVVAHKAYIDFFCDDEDSLQRDKGKMKTLRGVQRRLAFKHQDACYLKCATHEEDFGNFLQHLCQQRSWLALKIEHHQHDSVAPTQVSPVVAIGHPHGQPKHVTVGELEQSCPGDPSNLGNFWGALGLSFVYHDYTTKTCKGNSGGPVIRLDNIQETNCHKPYTHLRANVLKALNTGSSAELTDLSEVEASMQEADELSRKLRSNVRKVEGFSGLTRIIGLPYQPRISGDGKTDASSGAVVVALTPDTDGITSDPTTSVVALTPDTDGVTPDTTSSAAVLTPDTNRNTCDTTSSAVALAPHTDCHTPGTTSGGDVLVPDKNCGTTDATSGVDQTISSSGQAEAGSGADLATIDFRVLNDYLEQSQNLLSELVNILSSDSPYGVRRRLLGLFNNPSVTPLTQAQVSGASPVEKHGEFCNDLRESASAALSEVFTSLDTICSYGQEWNVGGRADGENLNSSRNACESSDGRSSAGVGDGGVFQDGGGDDSGVIRGGDGGAIGRCDRGVIHGGSGDGGVSHGGGGVIHGNGSGGSGVIHGGSGDGGVIHDGDDGGVIHDGGDSGVIRGDGSDGDKGSFHGDNVGGSHGGGNGNGLYGDDGGVLHG